MKIAFTNDGAYAYALSISTGAGGAERYQWLLARAQAAAGWAVTIGVRDGLRAGERRVLDGVEFVGIGGCQILLAWYRFLSLERPDWWYWQCADHMWGPAVEIARLLNVRTIFSAAVDRDVRPIKALFRRPYCWPLYAWGLFRCNKIFVQHQKQLASLPFCFRSKASILPGVVSVTHLAKPHPVRGNYVAWIAMLRQVKRPDLLIEIARALPQISFVVCGGPTTFFAQPGYGERIVSEFRSIPNIVYRGLVAPAEALEIIKCAAMLLSTSDEEGFPSTFVEAWSAGTPVISLKLDPDRVIERYGLGAVPGSLSSTIEAISDLVASAERRETIGILARQYVAENHSATAALSAFEEGIRQVTQVPLGKPVLQDKTRKI